MDNKAAKKAMIKRATRFDPEPMELGYIDFSSGKTFNPQMVGIVLNESYGGCSLVVACNSELIAGQMFKAKIGNIDPLKATFMWVKHLEENIYKVGVKFLE